MSEDLFGNEVPDKPTPAKPPTRSATNDMNVIAGVLRAACSSEPYVLVGPGQRVYRRVDKATMRPVARWEDSAVHQMVKSGLLSLGGQHLLRSGAVQGQ